MGDFEFSEFQSATLGHVHRNQPSQGAYAKILSKSDFDTAYHEIISWYHSMISYYVAVPKPRPQPYTTFRS